VDGSRFAVGRKTLRHRFYSAARELCVIGSWSPDDEQMGLPTLKDVLKEGRNRKTIAASLRSSCIYLFTFLKIQTSL